MNTFDSNTNVIPLLDTNLINIKFIISNIVIDILTAVINITGGNTGDIVIAIINVTVTVGGVIIIDIDYVIRVLS